MSHISLEDQLENQSASAHTWIFLQATSPRLEERLALVESNLNPDFIAILNHKQTRSPILLNGFL